jgi:hypothetical protein
MSRPPSQAVIAAVERAMCRLVHGEDWTVPVALPGSSDPRNRVAACYSCQRNGLEVARAAEAAALKVAADECEANARDWYGTDIFRDVDSADLAAVRSAMQAQGKDIDNLSAWYFRRALTARADILRRTADELTDTDRERVQG